MILRSFLAFLLFILRIIGEEGRFSSKSVYSFGKINKMKNRIKLPDFEVERVVSSMSEVVDWGLLQLNVPDTWEITMGEGINIFVLDTAGSTDHIDLKNNIIGGINFSNSKSLEDKNGHGTHVAGVMVAERNGIGCIGASPMAKVFLVKVLDDSGSGSFTSIENGLQFCLDSLSGSIKPNIISMSLGSETPLTKKSFELIVKLYENNVCITCAAGNSGREGVNYPAKYSPYVFAIGAFDQDKNIADFSTSGDEVCFSAPGVGVYSTWLKNSYAKLSGTSQATPFFASVIANLLSKHIKQEKETGFNDCRSPLQVREHLIRHAVDMGEAGKDKKWGYGIVDLKTMMKED